MVLLLRRREFVVRFSRVAGDLRTTWGLSRWIFLSGIVWTVGTHGYPLLIGGLRGKAEAGVWFACYTLAALANPLLMGITNSLGPAVANRAAANDSAGLRRFVGRSSVAFAGLMACWAMVALIGGELFLKVYDDKYAGYGALVGVLSLVSVAHSLGFASSRGLFALGGARHDFIANLLALAVMLGLGSWLVWSFGVFGGAAAMVASVAAGNAYRIVGFYKLARATEATP